MLTNKMDSLKKMYASKFKDKEEILKKNCLFSVECRKQQTKMNK